MMFQPLVLVLSAHLVLPVADAVPKLNVVPVCSGIAKQGGATFHDNAVAKERQNCIQSENVVRAQIVKEWRTFSAADKATCIGEAQMGGEPSYTELLTCLQMARDVRQLRSQSHAAENTGQKSSRAPAAVNSPE